MGGSLFQMVAGKLVPVSATIYYAVVNSVASNMTNWISIVPMKMWLSVELLLYSVNLPTISEIATAIKGRAIIGQRLVMYNNLPTTLSYKSSNSTFVSALVSDNNEYQDTTVLELGTKEENGPYIYELTGSATWYTMDGAEIVL